MELAGEEMEQTYERERAHLATLFGPAHYDETEEDLHPIHSDDWQFDAWDLPGCRCRIRKPDIPSGA